MKTWLWIAVGVAAAAGLLMLSGLVDLQAMLAGPRIPYTPPIVDAEGEVIPGSIATIETVTLGGVEQTITIRGVSTDNPVLLHLHGGPGVPSSPWATWNRFFAVLEESFVLVHWDQRGAGKSYSDGMTADDMTLSDFTRDGLELAHLLQTRFGQEKIILWGHSWGSALGFEILRIDSEPFPAFIASATRPRWNESQMLGYEKVLEIAHASGDRRAIRDLESIAPFDSKNPEHLAVRAKYLARYLVGDFRTEGMEDAWLGYVFRGRSPEYPSSLIEQTVAGIEFTSNSIGQEVIHSGYDHALDFPESPIPVYFLHGRYDYECPGDLAFDYYETLRAPAKDFVWFQASAHNIHLDEPNRFAGEVVRIVREVLDTAASKKASYDI